MNRLGKSEDAPLKSDPPRLRWTIGRKVFAIAGLLMMLMVVATVFATIKLTETSREIEALARYFVPTLDLTATIESLALRQEIVAVATRGGTPEERRAQLEALGARIDDDVARVLDLIKDGLASGDLTVADRMALGELRGHLVEIERLHQLVQDLALRAVDKGGPDSEIAAIRDNAWKTFDAALDDLVLGLQGTVEAAALDTADDEKRVLYLMLLATALALIVAIPLGIVLTRGMTRPVRVLMDGTKAVEDGDLSQDIPVTSSDEIGLLTHSFNHMVGELRAKARIEKAFGKYVDPRVIGDLVDEESGNDRLKLGGARRLATVSFADLAGFTAMSERFTPEALVSLMNNHFTLGSEPIAAHDGVIDKFTGDCVMAFWCEPFVAAGSEGRNAALSALGQIDKLAELRSRLPDILGLREGLPELRLRIGLATGDALVGSIGSENARNFTVMGDTVNLASRLEPLNKAYGTAILMCGKTRAGAGDAVVARELDLITVAGQNRPLAIYELQGRAGQVDARLTEINERYAAGLAAYRARDWDAAAATFGSVLDLDGEDGPARLFADRVEELRAAPPAPDWDGVWHFTKK